MLANVTQVLISLKTFFVRVRMLPDACILARRDQNLNLWRMHIERIIDTAFIVRSVCCTGKKGLFDLFQHFLHDCIIAGAILCQNHYLDLTVIRIGA